MLPDFVGIGAQRAATTWVYQCLQEHPEVFVAMPKELHFFDAQYEQGLSWHEGHVQSACQYKAVGEITPNYLNVDQAIPRMAKVIPDARLFVVLREPVARAYSAYQLLRDHAYRDMSFREACENGGYLTKSGLYTGQVQRVFDYYRSDQVIIGGQDPAELVPMEEIERRYIQHVLNAVGGNKTTAARVLGFDRKTLYRKLDSV